MTKLKSWQCYCGRYAERQCDWPIGTGRTCDKPVCRSCLREIEGKEYCPFHRGDPPEIAARKKKEADAAAEQAGLLEAAKAAAILGVPMVSRKP